MLIKKYALLIAVAAACGTAAAQTPTMTKEQHNAAEEQIEAAYKADKAACDALKDNAKDVCSKEAQGKQKVAKAELEQQYKPSASHARKVEEEKVKASYDVAKEKCDDLNGDAKNACQKQAKADEEKGKADLKARKM